MKKINNKTLIIILVVLVGIFAAVRIFRTPTKRSNLRKELVSLDTATVTQIKLIPKVDGAEITFKREGSKWTVTKFGREYNVDLGAANSLLGQLVGLKPQKMVSNKKEKWNDYQVGDSSTRVQVFTGSDAVADLKIGRIGFNQNPAQMQQQQYGGGGFGGAFTYVRLTDEDEVYTVDGFLESTFNRSLNDFRNKTLIRINADDVTKLSFNYPDSGFVAEKREKKWWIGTVAADSNKMKAYLNQISFKNATTFADDFVADRQPDLSLVVDGAIGTLATLLAWKRENDWVFATSQQTGVYFSSEGSGLFQTLFEQQKNMVSAKK
jgi:Domain of unknown function (DUF4340)